jgi:penicillin-binding protein 2
MAAADPPQLLQALYEGEPQLEAYPEGDRARIKTQQRELRDVEPQARIKPGKDQA